MNEYYTIINKILKTLENNINLTTSSRDNGQIQTNTIEHQQLFGDVEKSFTSLINLLKESDDNEMIISVLTNGTITNKFLTLFTTHIITCNNHQSITVKERKKNEQLYVEMDKLAIYSLRSLGYFLYSIQIVKQCISGEHQIKEISTLLENTIQISKSKNVCNYAIWCFSSQNFPNGPISSKLPSTYCQLLATTPFNSKTIENEILSSFHSLLLQNIRFYLGTIEIWLPLIFNKMLRLDNSTCIIDKLKEILSTVVEHYQAKNDIISEKLSTVLLGYCDEYVLGLTALYNSKNEILCIQTWGAYLYFIGKLLFINKMASKVLKIPENCFTHEDKLVRIETYKSWKLLIDCMEIEFLSGKKRLELIISPFATGFTSERDVEVKKTCFSTWMYFLKRFKQQLVDVFPIIFTPLFVDILKNKKTYQQSSTSQQLHQQLPSGTADLELGESALLLLVSIIAPSQDVRKECKLKLQNRYGIILDTLPLTFNTGHISQWLLGNLEPFVLAIQTNFITNGSNSIVGSTSYLNEKLEIWNGILKRMSNIDKKDSHYIPLVKNILIFIQQLFGQLDTSSLLLNDNELWFYRSIYQTTVSSIPNSVLIGASGTACDVNEYLIEGINGGKNYIVIDFFILNLIEFGFKLNSEQIKEFLLPLFDELCQVSFTNNFVDLSSRLNFIVGVMNDNIDSESSLIYLLSVWSNLTKIIQQFIEKSHQLLILPSSSIISILESISSLLLWPLRAIASTPYSSQSSVKPNSMLVVNFKLWRNTFQSMFRTFASKTTLNPTIAFIIQTIDDLKLSNHLNYYDFILSIIIPIIDSYDFSNIISGSGNGSNGGNKKLSKTSSQNNHGNNIVDPLISNLLINLNNLLVDCHFSKMMTTSNNNNQFIILNSLTPLFSSIATMIKKCKSVAMSLAVLKYFEPCLTIYIKDGIKPANDQPLLSKLDSQEKYQLTLIKDSFLQVWDSTFDVLISNSGNSSNHSDIYNSTLLEQMESLLVFSFNSPLNDIKQKVFTFWNETWGKQSNNQDLIYPSKLYKTFKKLENQIPIKLPNFNNQSSGNGNNNKRSNSHLDNYGNSTLGLLKGDDSFDDFNLPDHNSEINKFNNGGNNKLLNNNIIHGKEKEKEKEVKVKKPKISLRGDDKNEYIQINKPVDNHVSTLSLTEHQMEIAEKQQFKRNSSTTISSTNNTNTTSNTNSNSPSSSTTPILSSDQKYLENEDLLGQIKQLNDKLFENQSTLSLLHIQSVSAEITNKINTILKNRLFK